MNTGIQFKIVLSLIDRYGSNVEVIPVTKTTSNVEGDETLTEGTPYSTKIYISRRTVDFSVDVGGEIKNGDAVALIKPEQNINKNDVVVWNGNSYRVHDVIRRDQVGGEVMFKTLTLFLINNE